MAKEKRPCEQCEKPTTARNGICTACVIRFREWKWTSGYYSADQRHILTMQQLGRDSRRADRAREAAWAEKRKAREAAWAEQRAAATPNNEVTR